MVGAAPPQCAGLTRAGRRCSITSTCKLTDAVTGRLAAAPLIRGGLYCAFHAQVLCTGPADIEDGVLVFLDLETTGLDIASADIVEIGVIAGDSGAVFSTVVRPEAPPPEGPTVHGIDNAELAEGPSFPEAFARMVAFLDFLVQSAVASDSESSSDEVAQPRIKDVPPRVILVGHNSFKFDFPMLLSQCKRCGMTLEVFTKWCYADTLGMCRCTDACLHVGCLKLQCWLRVVGDEQPLRAHRALDDAVALRRVLNYVAGSLGVRPLPLVRPMAVELDPVATDAQLSVVLGL